MFIAYATYNNIKGFNILKCIIIEEFQKQRKIIKMWYNKLLRTDKA